MATPAAIAAAATVASGSGLMTAADAEVFQGLVAVASAQISIATITTALLVPIAVILADKYQRRQGIDGKVEFHSSEPKTRDNAAVEETIA